MEKITREQFLKNLDNRVYDAAKFRAFDSSGECKLRLEYRCSNCGQHAPLNTYCPSCGVSVVADIAKVNVYRAQVKEEIHQQDQQYYADMAEVLCVNIDTVRSCTNFIVNCGPLVSRTWLFLKTEEMLKICSDVIDTIDYDD